MKNIYFSLFAVIIFSTASFAQTDGMSVGTNATPLEMLDVNGAIKIGTDFTNHATNAPLGGIGTIRFRGNEFQGYTSTGWVSLSSVGALYTAGTGLSLSVGNVFSLVPHTGDVTGTTALTIEPLAVTTGKIAANAVTVGKLPTGATGTTFLRGDGTWVVPTNTTYTAGAGITIGGTTISHTAHTGDVTGTTALTIEPLAVTTGKIAANAVTVGKLPTGATGTTFLRGDGTWVVPTNTTYTGSTSIVLNGSSFERAALTGDVTAPQNSNATTIADNAVTTVKIINDAVDNTKLANMATQTIKGRIAATTGNPEDLTPAQVKTMLGLTDATTGTGTANKVAFWTGTSTLDDDADLHYNSTANLLGIGQPSPIYPLDVRGEGVSIPPTDDNKIFARFEQTVAARGAGIRIKGFRNSSGFVTSFVDLMNYGNPTNDYIVARVAAERGTDGTTNGSLLFYTNSGGGIVERMRINNAGVVRLNAYPTDGIVRTTGGNGTLSSTGGAINLASEVTGVLPVANGGTGSATQNFVDLTTAQTAAGIKTWSNNAIFNGNVGIGVSPTYKLDVAGTISANATVPFHIGTTGFAYITSESQHVAHYKKSGAYSFYFRKSDNGLVSGPNEATLMEIADAGNVGIGVSPSYKLDVNGDMNMTTGLRMSGVPVIFNSSTDVYANIRVLQNNSTAYQDGMYINYNSTGGTAADLRFYADGTNQRMHIQASTGNVGIGSTAPVNKLEVNGNGRFGTSGNNYIYVGSSATTGNGGLEIFTLSNVAYIRYHDPAVAWRDIALNDAGGNVGVGTASPAQKFSVAGTLGISESGSTGNRMTISSTGGGAEFRQNDNSNMSFYVNGDEEVRLVNGAGNNNLNRGSWGSLSDSRTKTDVRDLEHGLADILDLRPVSYFQYDTKGFDYSPENIQESGKKDIGFIAQELYQVIPEMVVKPKNENETFWAVTYERIAPVLVKAIQEQQEIIEELKTRLEAVERR